MATTTTAGRGWAISLCKQVATASTGTSVSTGAIKTPGVAGTAWPRWLQGSHHGPDAQFNHEWEGDGSRGESLAWRRFQYGKASIICYPRPDELALIMAAISGIGSDAVTTGATTTPGGSYTTHNIAVPLVDAGLAYYTITSLIRGTDYIWQTADSLVQKVTISGSKGMPVKLQVDFVGGVNQYVSAAGVSPAVTIAPDVNGPFYFFNGTWSLGGYATSDWNPSVTDFSISFEITLNPEDYQAEGIFPLPMVAGNVAVSGEMTLFWQNGDAMRQAYFGTVSGTVDVGAGSVASQIAVGDLVLDMASSTVFGTGGAGGNDLGWNSKLELPRCAYEGATFEPDLTGKPVEQKVQLRGLKGSTSTVLAANIKTPWALNAKCIATGAF